VKADIALSDAGDLFYRLQNRTVEEKIMPITSIGSYVPTAQEISTHWGLVNAALGVTPLLLRGAYSVALFNTDTTAIQSSINALLAATNAFSTASGNLTTRKINILPRLPQFRKAVTALMPTSGYANSLPTAPGRTVAESKFTNPYQDMFDLWTKINADVSIPGFTPPILLAGGYTLVLFTADLTALRTAYSAYNASKVTLDKALGDRDLVLPAIYDRIKQYRELVLSRFAEIDPLVQSLPRLTPLPGSTPQPVQDPLAAWDAVKKEGIFTYTASPSANITGYELRYSASVPYNANNEITVETVLPNKTEMRSAKGLTAPGDEALFKIVTKNASGNEKSSKVLKAKYPV